MSKQSQSTAAPTRAKAEQKTAPNLLPDLASVAPENAGLLDLGKRRSMAGSANPLANPHLGRPQRQMVAGQIGQHQGNSHLQQLLRATQRTTPQVPYQPNNLENRAASAGSHVVHRRSHPHLPIQQPEQNTQSDLETMPTDEEIASLWGEDGLGQVAGAADPPADNGAEETAHLSGFVQREEAAEADDLPAEAEKAAAKAKAAAARVQASQTQSQGQAESEKFQARKTAETGEKQAAQSKAAAAKAAAPAPGEKAGAAAEAPAAGGGGRRQQPALNGAGPAPAAAGLEAGGAAEKAPASAAEDPAFQAVTGKVKGVAAKEQVHAPAAVKAQEAQAAAESPAGEVMGKAQSNQVGEMDAAETPGFDAKAFKAKLMQRIEALTPKNAADADEFKEQNKAGELKGELQSETTAQQEQSQAPLAAATEQGPDTGSVPPKPTTPLQSNTPGAGPTEVDASGAAPKPKSQGEVEAPLQERSQQLDDKMGAANVTEEQLANSNEPEFQAANTARQETQAHAASAPQAYRQDEQNIVTQAQAGATTTTQTDMASMHDTRAGALSQVDAQQAQGKSEDEKKRAEVGDHIQSIYSETQTNVDTILNSLDSEVDKLFNEGAEAAKQTFESYVDAEMEAYKEERYGGWLGWAQWIEDKFQPTQPEILAIFRRGRQTYIQAMDAVIENVVALIGRKLAEAKAAIANGKQKIQEYVAGLDPDLQQVGQQAAQDIQSKFDELEQGVDAKQGELIEKLANSYNEKLQAVDARIEELKAENETLYDKAANTIDGVIGTILNLKNMLLGVLARAAAAVEAIIKDPIGFLGNLVEGVKQGLNGFISNISTHLKNGFIGWLTGAISGAGIALPENWDLPGIFQLVMQVLGLSFESIMGKLSQLFGFDLMAIIDPVQQVIAIYQEQGFEGLVRAGLARLIGEERMEALMQVWGIIQNVISGSWNALWGMLQDQLTNLKEMVFGKIEEFLTESVIKAGITWIIGLLNPAGAFIKACKAIYDIVMFFVERGSQIMSLVNAVIDSIGSIASGSLGAAASAVEQALAKGIPVAIGFLASLLGLGNVSEKVQEIIESVRGLVDRGINAIFNSRPVQMVVGFIKKLVDRVKSVLGFGEEKEESESASTIGEQEDRQDADTKLDDGEIGSTEAFSANNEPHKLWIDVSSGHPVIMLASTPSSLKSFLERAEVQDLKEIDTEGHINQATNLLESTNYDAAEVLKAISQDNDAIAESKDKDTENDLKQLSIHLRWILVNLDKQGKGIDEGMIALYRGIHFDVTWSEEDYDRQLRQSLIGHPTFSAAARELAGSNSPDGSDVSSSDLEAAAELVQESVKNTKDPNTAKKWWGDQQQDFDSYFLALLQRYVNTYKAFSQELNEGRYENLEFTRIPFLSTTKKARHAAQYATGEKSQSLGQRKQGIVGRLFIYLFTIRELITQEAIDVQSLHAEGRIKVNSRILHEGEVTFTGSIPGENLVEQEDADAEDSAISLATRAENSAKNKASSEGGLREW